MTDDETPAITLSGTSLSVPEEGNNTYTVRLATEPVGGSVTVTITGAADGLVASPTSLTFTAANWDTTRTVTVTAANDLNGDNENVTFSHAASGADYGSVTAAELVATSTDNDTPSLAVTPTTLEVDENNSGTYTIRLNTQPSANVTVTVTGAERRGDGGHGAGGRQPEHADVHERELEHEPDGDGGGRRRRQRHQRDADAGARRERRRLRRPVCRRPRGRACR